MNFIITAANSGARVIYRDKEDFLKNLSQMINKYQIISRCTRKKVLDIAVYFNIENDNVSIPEDRNYSADELLEEVSRLIDECIRLDKAWFEISFNISHATFLMIMNKKDYRKTENYWRKSLRMLKGIESLENYLPVSCIPCDKKKEAENLIQQLKDILICNY